MSINDINLFILACIDVILNIINKIKINIAHRDIKPANIMVSENMQFKLVDFG